MFVVPDGKDTVGIGSVLSDDDSNDSIQLFGTVGVDALDAGVRVRRMQSLSDEHSWKREVVGVFAGTCGLAGGINHGDCLTDDGEIRHWSSPAARTPRRATQPDQTP